MDPLHILVTVRHSSFLFCVKSWSISSFECLQTSVWNNFQKMRQLELDKYVFVDVFQRFVFIALLINVMFLESFKICFQLSLAKRAKMGICGILRTSRSWTWHEREKCEDWQNNFHEEMYSKRMATLSEGMSSKQLKG
jgi:hypothetical protein